ncbi:MAG: monooxygenase [Azospirillum sp.]|nr:monooxygenase [Azospirillum sp.]
MAKLNQVLIVGAGPVGLAMAVELTRHGVGARIIDQAPARSEHSKALVLWARSLELMEAMGCADRFVAAGLKVHATRIFANQRPVARIALNAVPSRFDFALMVNQAETERLLEEHLNRLGVRVERRVTLTGFNQDGEGVLAALSLADGTGETVTADWLIGCDGAHSTVRRTLGLEFQGDTEPSDWVLADVYFDGPRDCPILEPGTVNFFWHPEGILGTFPITADRYRVVADLGEAKGRGRRADPTLEELQQLLDRRGPGGIVAHSPVWLSAFRINERKVGRYRSGRVFLAGDAAHIHSPAGGQGMNTGLQDAVNLAWKLALVCRGRAQDGVLLDSYDHERGPVAARVIRAAGRATRVSILRNPLGQAIRNRLVDGLTRLAAVRRAVVRMLSEIDIAYPDSPLNRLGRSAPRRRGRPGPGDRAPDLALAPSSGEPATLHSRLASGRFLLLVCGAEVASPALSAFAARWAADLTVVEPASGAGAAYGGLTLIRPDGYVAVTAEARDVGAVEGWLTALLNGRHARATPG